jgi:hypothetical protein
MVSGRGPIPARDEPLGDFVLMSDEERQAGRQAPDNDVEAVFGDVANERDGFTDHVRRLV